MSLTEIVGSSVSIGLALFIVWMLLHCIAYEDERTERVSWALLIGICGFIGAPIYFFRRYLPRRKAWNQAMREQSLKANVDRRN